MSFADTGPGINPQQTEKIFEPFQSNFEGGTGLGLAIVYQIVQAHEGKVWARSEVGKGTSFVLRLRRMDQTRRPERRGLELPPYRASARAASLPRQRKEERVGNILVCDDERSICELLDIALRRDGHKVETVTGGEAAKRKIDSALFDVIVTDIKMPGVDGSRSPAPRAPDLARIRGHFDDRRGRLRSGGASGESRRRDRLHPQESRPGGRSQTRHRPRARPKFRSAARTLPCAATRPRATRSTTSSAPVPRSKN